MVMKEAKERKYQTFRSLGNMTRNVHLDWHEDRTPSVMADGFKLLADAGYERAMADRRHPDQYFYAIAYNYRHALELKLKFVLEIAKPIFNEEYKNFGHDLAQLWKDVRRVAVRIWPGADTTELAPLEVVIREVSGLDPDGQSFRYFRTKTGERNLSEAPRVISLEVLAKALDEAWDVLSALEAGIDEAADWAMQANSNYY